MTKSTGIRRKWTDEDRATLRAGYANPDITRPEVAASLGRGLKSIEQEACRMRLVKVGARKVALPAPPPPKPQAPRRTTDWHAHAAELRRRGIGEATVQHMLAQVGIR